MEKLLGNNVAALLKDKNHITEIRIRKDRRILVKTFFDDYFLDFVTSGAYIDETTKRAMRFSPYAFEDEISSGYLHYAGGIRIGLGGRGKAIHGGKITFAEYTSLCIRIPHAIQGISDKIGDFSSFFDNTLVFSPPYCGKTTLIRDMTRVLSHNYDTLLIDEREELCGDSSAKFFGERIDVIQGIPKKHLYENIIRAMSPEVVVCDELFGKDDFFAVNRMTEAGVKCLASYHAGNFESIPEELKKSFTTFIELTDRPKIGTIAGIRRSRD